MSALLKFVYACMQPLAMAWLLLTGWLLICVIRRRWRGTLLPSLAWLIITLIACTPVPSVLLAQLEGQHPRAALAGLPPFDAVVCLGGGAEPSESELTGVHFKSAADRFATAWALAAIRPEIPLAIGGGGYRYRDEVLSEADAVAEFATAQAPAGTTVISLGICADTRDEAVKVAALAQERRWRSVALVTSASHMPRAAAVFRHAGIEVVPVPCNYLSSFNRNLDVRWFHLPHAGGFDLFGAWCHEVAGTWVYRSRGWL